MPQRMATVLVAILLLSAGFAGSAVADDPVLPLAFSTNTFAPYNGNENLGDVSLDDGDVVIQAFKAEASGQVTDVWIMGGYAPPDGALGRRPGR